MKKIIVFLVSLILILSGVIYFANTQYFFKKYIVTNIKKYNFDYDKVNGNILRGFIIKNLKYKNKILSKKVELRLNPFKILKKTVSISKLHLIGVDKDILDEVIKDFRKDNKNSNQNSETLTIDLNFEFENIILNFKHFKIKDINVYYNSLKIDYIGVNNKKLILGNTKFFFNTDIGKLYFDGKYDHRILKIKKVFIKNLDIKKALAFISSLKKQENNNSKSSKNDFVYIPKEMLIDEGFLSLKEFKLNHISTKDFKILLKDAKFNIDKLALISIYLNIEYNSKLGSLILDGKYINNILNIYKSKLDIKEPNKIVKIIQNILKDNNSSSSSSNIKVNIKKVNIFNSFITINNFTYKNEYLKKFSLFNKEINYNIKNNNLDLKETKLLLTSSLADIKLNSSFKNKELIVDFLDLNILNVNKIISLIKPFLNKKSKKASNKKIVDLIFVKKANIKLNKLYFADFNIEKTLLKGLKINILNKDKIFFKSGKVDLALISNWANANLKGGIKDNKYLTNGEVIIKKSLITKYSLPLNVNNLKPLEIDGVISLKDLDLNIKLKGNNILKSLKDFDIKNSINRFYYSYKEGYILLKTDALINSNYIQNIKLNNILEYKDKNLIYYGTIKPTQSIKYFRNIFLFDNLIASYKGDKKSINIDIKTSYLKAKLISPNYKKANIKITNIKNIPLNRFTKDIKALKDVKITKANIKTSLDFKNIFPLKGDINIDSNLVNIKGTFSYNKILKSKLVASLSKNSILHKYKPLKPTSLFPAKIDIKADKKIDIQVKNRIFNAILNYNKYLNLKAKTASIKAIYSSLDKRFQIKSSNLNSSIKEISKVIKLAKLPNIKGNIEINGNLKNNLIKIKSSLIKYEPKKSNIIIKNLKLSSIYKNNFLYLKKYSLNLNKYKLFSTKSSIFQIKNNIITIKKFWINNALLLNGIYNTKKQSAKLNAKATGFKFENPDIKMNLSLNNKVNLNKEKIFIKGGVNIINAVIKKNFNKKGVDDEDIIIIQRHRKKKSSPFVKNVKLNIILTSKKGIIYKQKDSYFILYPNLKIMKNYNSFMKINGKVKVDKKSYYVLNGKRLRVKEGTITFKNKTTPYLNIVLMYKGREYTIYITVSGSANRPILYFSSNPPLSKDQILAYLLFGDESAAGTHSQQSMLNLIGSSLTKSFLGTIGIKVDHISIKEKGFSIGKNITKNITIYYNQDGEKSSVKTRVDITNSIHTEIEVGSESQSIDIIFSKEY